MGWEELHGVIESIETLVTVDSVALAFLCAVDGLVLVDRRDTIIPSRWSIEPLDGFRHCRSNFQRLLFVGGRVDGVLRDLTAPTTIRAEKGTFVRSAFTCTC